MIESAAKYKLTSETMGGKKREVSFHQTKLEAVKAAVKDSKKGVRHDYLIVWKDGRNWSHHFIPNRKFESAESIQKLIDEVAAEEEAKCL